MGEHVGTLAGYEVYWNSETGAVWVGGELCEYTADGHEGAFEVARGHIGGGFMAGMAGVFGDDDMDGMDEIIQRR